MAKKPIKKDEDSWEDEDWADEEDFDEGSSTSPIKIVLIIFAVIGGLMMMLFIGGAVLLMPAIYSARSKASKIKCSNNLKQIGIASILYSDDHRFFPHMKPLAQEQGREDVSDVFRTFMYLKYIDNPEAYICPESEDFAMPLSDAVLNDPKKWDWQLNGGVSSRDKPVIDSSGLDVFDNDELSYTYMRRALNGASARSNSIVAADKATRNEYPSGPVGNHDGGYNILFADGHTRFVSKEESETIDLMYQRLRMASDDNPH